MKIRVYVDAKNDFLFEDIDKVIYGVRDSIPVTDKIAGRLVLMRKRKVPENAEITTKEPTVDTVAVFNTWMFWKEVSSTPVTSTPNVSDDKTEDLIKKVGGRELKGLRKTLERLNVQSNMNGGLYAYGLWSYVNEELKRRQKKEAEDSGICTTGHL